VTGHFTTFRKDHPPRQVCGTSIELAVDEIADAPQTEADRYGYRNQIRDLPEIPALLPRYQQSCQYHSDESAMERHSALPDVEY